MKCNSDAARTADKTSGTNSPTQISVKEFMEKHNNQVYMLCELAEIILTVDGTQFASLRAAAHNFLEQHDKLNQEMKKNGVCLG